jgi:hypothetical protein
MHLKELYGKRHCIYDESDESSLDGHFSRLLLERNELASAEKLATLSVCP